MFEQVDVPDPPVDLAPRSINKSFVFEVPTERLVLAAERPRPTDPRQRDDMTVIRLAVLRNPLGLGVNALVRDKACAAGTEEGNHVPPCLPYHLEFSAELTSVYEATVLLRIIQPPPQRAILLRRRP